MSKRLSRWVSRVKQVGPRKGPAIIAIVGNGTAKTLAAKMLREILKEDGWKVTCLLADELDNKLDATDELLNFVTSSKRARAEYAIVDITDDLIPQLSKKTPITMAVMAPISFEKPDAHADVDEQIEARFRLFDNEPRYIVLGRDDKWYENFDEFMASEIKICYGKDAAANVRIENVKAYKKGTEVHLVLDGAERLEVATYDTDKLSDYAMAVAASAASLLDVDPDVIQEGIANHEP